MCSRSTINDCIPSSRSDSFLLVKFSIQLWMNLVVWGRPRTSDHGTWKFLLHTLMYSKFPRVSDSHVWDNGMTLCWLWLWLWLWIQYNVFLAQYWSLDSQFWLGLNIGIVAIACEEDFETYHHASKMGALLLRKVSSREISIHIQYRVAAWNGLSRCDVCIDGLNEEEWDSNPGRGDLRWGAWIAIRSIYNHLQPVWQLPDGNRTLCNAYQMTLFLYIPRMFVRKGQFMSTQVLSQIKLTSIYEVLSGMWHVACKPYFTPHYIFKEL